MSASVHRSPGLPCVHCGLCLDNCPTYRLDGNEAESPRGRIYIMEAVLSGSQDLDAEARAHLDSCLGCLACESACPSGVAFSERIEGFRPDIGPSGFAGYWRAFVHRTIRSQRALRTGLWLAAAMDVCGLRTLRRRIPGLGILPGRNARLWSTHPSGNTARTEPGPQRPEARVFLLHGCIADTLRPSITSAAVSVLHRNGLLVVDTPTQSCCGALALHSGRNEEARDLARATVRNFAHAGVDRLVTTAAGCGAMIKSYGRLLADDTALRDDAARTAACAVDIHELLVEQGIDPPTKPLGEVGVAYHDACHLVHAQGVREGPRIVLEFALGHRPPDLGENNICCGSAGSYNVEQPRRAALLGRRKAELAAEEDIRTVAVGNIGCMLQIERAGDLLGARVRAAHPIELLAEAYRRGKNSIS